MSHPISCREAVRQLWRFLDGELDPGDRASVEEHLERCVACCGELEFAGELRLLLGAQRTAALPADVRDRLENFVDVLGEGTLDDR